MKKILCLLVMICASGTSLYYPEEDDINYKRYQTLITKSGDIEEIDLMGDGITAYAQASDLTYYLYTKNSETPQVIRSPLVQFGATVFDSKKNTFVIIHGWVDDHTADVNVLIKSALLSKYDVNIVIVDWSPVASQSYFSAQGSVQPLGSYVATFITDLSSTYGVSIPSITLIGHSLGAHIAGNAGAALNGQIGHIIGLDPASPAFTVAEISNRLDPTDAQFVQVIHTNGRFLGFSSSLGHADFYPNGGMIQAGCGLDLLGGCSHARAFQYLAEAILGAPFTATKCDTYSNFQTNKCSTNAKTSMGLINVNKK